MLVRRDTESDNSGIQTTIGMTDRASLEQITSLLNKIITRMDALERNQTTLQNAISSIQHELRISVSEITSPSNLYSVAADSDGASCEDDGLEDHSHPPDDACPTSSFINSPEDHSHPPEERNTIYSHGDVFEMRGHPAPTTSPLNLNFLDFTDLANPLPASDPLTTPASVRLTFSAPATTNNALVQTLKSRIQQRVVIPAGLTSGLAAPNCKGSRFSSTAMHLGGIAASVAPSLGMSPPAITAPVEAGKGAGKKRGRPRKNIQSFADGNGRWKNRKVF
ncbi:hypothetical protein BC830DRAFT_209547 [Chytriomyces sp. MP71]|nr:hypothetical protein BC830DRAFT_209547 [Chytriomyces sp. MP71]